MADEVPAPQRAEFERHLAVCPECVAYLRTYRQTIALGRAAYADEPFSDACCMPEELVRAIVAALGKPASDEPKRSAPPGDA